MVVIGNLATNCIWQVLLFTNYKFFLIIRMYIFFVSQFFAFLSISLYINWVILFIYGIFIIFISTSSLYKIVCLIFLLELLYLSLFILNICYLKDKELEMTRRKEMIMMMSLRRRAEQEKIKNEKQQEYLRKKEEER